MQYYNPEDRKPRLWGLLGVLLYAAILTLLMLTIRFSIFESETIQQGILVEFGESDLGLGIDELAATDISTPTPPPLEQIEEMIETDPEQEVEIPQKPSETPLKEPSPTEQPIEQPDTTKVEPRVVNQLALFPGRKDDSSSSSQGTSGSVGNQGAQSGAQSGAVTGGGFGDQAVAELKDRSVVGQLPLPAYNANAAGKVIIDITVDEDGKVKSATYRSQGSTTNNSSLVSAAQEAALKARFTPSDNFIQGGTITYIFRMN